MFYLYFSFALLISGAVLFYCMRLKHPKWYAALVLLAPVTTPYVIYKMKKMEGMMAFTLFVALFSLVCAGESLIWVRSIEAQKWASLPPVTRKILDICDRVKETNHEVDEVLIRLETISKVESTARQINDTLVFMEEVRETLTDNRDAIENLLEFTKAHGTYLDKKEMRWVYELKQFYTHPKVIRHDQSLKNYLKDFELMLNYANSYFYEISEIFDPAYMKNYDQYYFRYRRAVDRHIAYNSDRIQFQETFARKAPRIKEYLPGPRQTNTFRLIE
ncbi:MAG: hypothetical protein MI747_06675 [Desulfobacterales bacterium]|nr:hypothetical protein [Desulfobacterales bacterium]